MIRLVCFLFNTNLGEVQQPVQSWQGPGLAVGRLPWSLCHPSCWRSYKSHNWRGNNTGHTGFGQMSYMRDNPAENNMKYEHTKTKNTDKKTKNRKGKNGKFLEIIRLTFEDFTSVSSYFTNLLFPPFCVLYIQNN